MSGILQLFSKRKSCTGPSPASLAAALGLAGAIAAPATKPTDPQIAHIAHTAGQLDIEAAKQALEKSKNQEVRTFAQRMVGDHTSVNDQALALVQKLNVTPEDNPTSQSLTQAADAERKKLAGLDGAALDKAYVDNEVAYQKTVNEAFPKLKGFPVEFGGSGEQIAE
jgi:putative membrane protein